MKPERVLLVDDEPNLVRLLGAVLRSGGFHVKTAPSSAAALALAADYACDVLVTDVSLDEMDGPALAARLAQRDPELLVVFISGYEMDGKTMCASLKRCAFLQKPFPPREILKAIAELADGGGTDGG